MERNKPKYTVVNRNETLEPHIPTALPTFIYEAKDFTQVYLLKGHFPETYFILSHSQIPCLLQAIGPQTEGESRYSNEWHCQAPNTNQLAAGQGCVIWPLLSYRWVC